jgi:hypothetical protein
VSSTIDWQRLHEAHPFAIEDRRHMEPQSFGNGQLQSVVKHLVTMSFACRFATKHTTQRWMEARRAVTAQSTRFHHAQGMLLC